MAIQKKSTVKRYILLPDIHFPYYQKAAWKAVLTFISQNRPDGVIFTGDQIDNQNISHHTVDKPGLRERGGYQKDIDGFIRDILDPLEKLLSRNCLRIWINGNHERMVEDLLEKSPELEGAIGIAENLKLKERGYQVIPVGGHYTLNGILILHGDSIGSALHVAKKLVDETCRTSIMGHIHRFSAFTKVGVELADKWAAFTLPCLSTLAPAYARGRLNAYLNGFGIIEAWGHKRNSIYVPIIVGGTFSYGGKRYGGKQ